MLRRSTHIFCTLENLQDFKLDPPRTQAKKDQAALVLISSVLQASSAGQPASFMVDSVQLLQPSEVGTVKSCLKRMLFLTTLAGHMASRKRDAPASLTHEESPAKASKCRVLGRHPTAAPVPEFSCGQDDTDGNNADQIVAACAQCSGMQLAS